MTFDDIHLIKGKHNSPDYITFTLEGSGKIDLGFEDRNAYPIIIVPDTEEVHVGPEGETHPYFSEYKLDVKFDSLPSENLGRIWNLGELIVFSMWAWDYDNAVYMVEEAISYLNLSPDLVVGFLDESKEDMTEDVLGYYTTDKGNDFIERNNREEIERLRNLHLQNAQNKWNNTENFRQYRDELNAKKLGNMTQAQWNDMKYGEVVAESKRKTKTIKESLLRKLIREAIIREMMPQKKDK